MSHLMKRKLVKQGLRALTMTLPTEWLVKHSLKAGDELSVIEIDNSLSISAEGIPSLKDITVDISGLYPRLADRFIARAYQKGYDKITVKFDSPELLMAIKNKIPELMGFEILNITKDSLEIQVLSHDLSLDFDVLLRRAWLTLKEMSNTLGDAWKAGDNAALNALTYQDTEVNKYLYFCLRYLNKSQKIMNFGRSILYYQLENLEDLGDELKLMGQLLATEKPDASVQAILKQLNQQLALSYEFFYSPHKNKALESFDLNKRMNAELEELFGKKDKNLTRVLVSLRVSSHILYHIPTMRLDTLRELGG